MSPAYFDAELHTPRKEVTSRGALGGLLLVSSLPKLKRHCEMGPQVRLKTLSSTFSLRCQSLPWLGRAVLSQQYIHRMQQSSIA